MMESAAGAGAIPERSKERPETPLEATLIVLAGGRSVRMGRPKASLELGVNSMLGSVIRRLGGAFTETVVGGLTGEPPPDVTARVVADLREGVGPLAGIEAGLRAASYARAFVVACDMPGVTQDLARLLVTRLVGYDAATVRLAGRPEPVCAAYSATSLGIISAFLDRGGRRAAELLGLLAVRFVDEPELARAGIDPATLENLNTPEEYAAFVSRPGRSR